MVSAGYTEPRPVQSEAIPPALKGRDVLGLAQTGTGKTAAFVLPILQRLLGSSGDGLRALVVAPTRELASQVHAEFERLAKFTPLRSAAVFGGVPIPRQVRELARKPAIVVACPGRLLDLMSQGALSLDRVQVLVLDEADHMFDMGFLPDVRRILRALPQNRQNLLFSATMPREIRRLADAVLHRPAVVELGHSQPAETIAHAIYPTSEGDKIAALERLMSSEDFTSAIVFLRTKRRAKRLAQRLDETGHAAVALQGNMSQPQRERALAGFREERFNVLVATDIAARGLDIAGVSHVVNFDVPNTPDAYTHRIGRTGRSEMTGRAFTFVTQDDADAVRQIEKRLGSRIERRKLSELGPLESETLKGGGRSSAGGHRRGAQSGPKTSRGRGAAPGRRKRGASSAKAPSRAPARATTQAVVRTASETKPTRPDGPAFGAGVPDAWSNPKPKQSSSATSGGAGRPRRRRRR